MDVIIINYNQEKELKLCVASVIEAGSGLVCTVRVRNTGSAVNLGGVITVNGRNIGYGAACNEQSKLCSSEYLLFLNADIVLPKNAITETVGIMDRFPDVGICGVEMSNQAVKMNFPTLGQLIGRSFGFRGGYMRPDQSESGYTDWVLGAFMLVRRSAFEGVCGFDEKFFLYFEETDLAKRMLKAGWKCYYHAGCLVEHKGGKSATKPFSIEQYARSRIIYANKHFLRGSVLWLRASIAMVEPWLRLVQGAVTVSSPIAFMTAPWRGIGGSK